MHQDKILHFYVFNCKSNSMHTKEDFFFKYVIKIPNEKSQKCNNKK